MIMIASSGVVIITLVIMDVPFDDFCPFLLLVT